MRKSNKLQFRKNFGLFCIFLSLTTPTAAAANNNGTTQQSMYVKNIISLAKSSEMRSFMNANENPCHNFYEYACGNWAQINPINRIEKQTSALELLKRTYERKIHTLLNANTSASETLADRKVKTFYKSCKAAYNDFDRNQLHGLISDFGPMPLLAGDNWNETNFDWLQLLAKIKRNFGLQILIGLDVKADLKYNSIDRLYIGQPALKLNSKAFYLEDLGLPYRNAYRNDVAAHLQAFTELEPNYALHTAEEIVGFEILLAKGMIDDNANLSRAHFAIETTIDELQAKYAPTIDIKTFLNLTLGDVPHGPIYEVNGAYLKNLKYVLETTNTQLLGNYMFYMLLKNFLLMKPEKCQEKVKQHFAKQLANMVYRKLNVGAAVDDLKTMWHGLRKAFKTKLYNDNLSWLTPTVREYAEQKLNDLHMEIESFEERNFSADYLNLTITPNDYIKNLQQIYQFESQEMFQKINKPSTYFDGNFIELAIPYNEHSKNIIKLPVMLLQPYLLWAAHYPMSVKFGTLGFLIGRALIHSFDDRGRLYNKQGEPTNWWDEPTTNAFMARRECFLQQYPVSVEKLNDLDADSENIADNAGLNLAFEAFVDWLKNNADNSTKFSLPQFAHSKEQIFFISFAQLLCNDVGPYFRASLEQHISGNFRVLGVLSNSKLFAKVFNCASGTPMNPKEKCELF